MQVVRLPEPRPRTLRSKLVEVWRAVQLEWHLSKADILRLYLTYAPYGSNVEGVSAASYLYFGHAAASPRRLKPPFVLVAAGAVALGKPIRRPSGMRPGSVSCADWRAVAPDTVRGRTGPARRSAHRAATLAAPAAHFADYVRQRYADRTQLTTSIAIDVQRLLDSLYSVSSHRWSPVVSTISPCSWWRMPPVPYVA